MGRPGERPCRKPLATTMEAGDKTAWPGLPWSLDAEDADMTDMPQPPSIRCHRRAAGRSGVAARGRAVLSGAALFGATIGLLVPTGAGHADDAEPPRTQAERMAALGLIRYRGAWRTSQEIELIERDEAATRGQVEWKVKIKRLRRSLAQPATADRAAEELREISDPLAVSALAEAFAAEQNYQVRCCYLESLARIRSPEALAILVGVARDHPDSETRITAVEHLVAIGPHQAVSPLVASLASSDNAQVNRAADALGRLGVQTAIGPLIDALETRHVVTTGGGQPAGSTSATFTPQGGGLSMGGGPKQKVVSVRNDRVLEALVTLTGENFEWNAAAWRAWLVNQRSLPEDFDPRRD